MNERDTHQKMLITLTGHLQARIMDGELRAAPTGLYLGDRRVMPDLFWVNGHNQSCAVQEDGDWHGSPDLIIEIISPDTEARDRGARYSLYQNHDVHEYWIVNPVLSFLEVFVMMNKRYFRTGLYTFDESFSSGVLGRSFTGNELWG